MIQKSLIIALLFFANNLILANTFPKPDQKVVYKKVGDIELSLFLFFPEKNQRKKNVPAIVFFHGGGWNGGGASHFFNQSSYFASRGIVAISVQYRTKKANNTSPIECVKDAKSAMRWIRSHAKIYGIDPDMIIAGGGSAGGHLAAATSILEGFNEEGEDTGISCKAKALVLFNPVVNNGPNGYGFARVKAYWESFSPYHNLDKNAPPTLIMLGTKDTLFTPEMAESYKRKMLENGARCDMILYEGYEHAFFNLEKSEDMHYKTMEDADVFLTSLGFLKGKSTIEEFKKRK